MCCQSSLPQLWRLCVCVKERFTCVEKPICLRELPAWRQWGDYGESSLPCAIAAWRSPFACVNCVHEGKEETLVKVWSRDSLPCMNCLRVGMKRKLCAKPLMEGCVDCSVRRKSWTCCLRVEPSAISDLREEDCAWCWLGGAGEYLCVCLFSLHGRVVIECCCKDVEVLFPEKRKSKIPNKNKKLFGQKSVDFLVFSNIFLFFFEKNNSRLKIRLDLFKLGQKKIKKIKSLFFLKLKESKQRVWK